MRQAHGVQIKCRKNSHPHKIKALLRIQSCEFCYNLQRRQVGERVQVPDQTVVSTLGQSGPQCQRRGWPSPAGYRQGLQRGCGRQAPSDRENSPMLLGCGSEPASVSAAACLQASSLPAMVTNLTTGDSLPSREGAASLLPVHLMTVPVRQTS